MTLPERRQVGGMWCDEVLVQLGDVAEGVAPSQVAAAVAAHLEGCDTCARFGAAYASLVQQVRALSTVYVGGAHGSERAEQGATGGAVGALWDRLERALGDGPGAGG